ncbi:hypothetical protein IKF86_01430 [Candidatus Saccharibacteria bacterium]|nr:hypothetical protein [Candidatus Saccharibacteria bacterium]
MADLETEKKWENSKRIEEERLRAYRDTEAQKGHPENKAFLTPVKPSKWRFYSDPDVTIRTAEKLINAGVIMTVTGIALMIIGIVGEVTSFANKLGAGAAIIVGLPTGLGLGLIAVAMFITASSLVIAIIVGVKNKRNVKGVVWAAAFSILLVVVFFVLKNVLKI